MTPRDSLSLRRLGQLALTLTALTLVLVPVARASSGLQADLQDQSLLTDTPAQLTQDLQTLRLLGVTRVRLTISWDAVAPSPDSRVRPAHFDAFNPAAYPASGWLPYDTVLAAAARYGFGLGLDVNGGAPLWAAQRTSSRALAHVWYPSAAEFGAFMRAVAVRYSGHFAAGAGAVSLPRVTQWSPWDEPNAGASSLAPQTIKGAEVAPGLYRSLADAAYTALARTGHGRDTILVGGMTASGAKTPGSALAMDPLRFLRALFCVDSGYRRLTGKAAKLRGCPTGAAASRAFRAQNPALFHATGWSHEPSNVPGQPSPDTFAPPQDPDWVTLPELPRLESSLDRLQRAYGSSRRYPLYLSRYGYDTRPPQGANAVSLRAQAAFINQAEYIAWHDPRVVSLTQTSLRDAARISSVHGTDASGLMFATGVAKPAFSSFRLPLYLPVRSALRGVPLELWGCIRPAHVEIPDTHHSQLAQILFQPASSGPFLELGVARIFSAKSCYFDLRVQPPESGTLMLAYTYPSTDPSLPAGTTVYSRGVRVALR